MAFIELENISFTYPTSNTKAVDNLSLQVHKGEFIVLFGPSGSGKSTLLRLLKKDIQPHGELTGTICINGVSLDSALNSKEIGFVFQDPENQLVADDVLHELVFGLENIGLSTNKMRARVAEMVHFFGIEPLLHRKTYELSGGMKQQINLASVLLMQPEILLLDEPTAQLDPVSAREFLDMLVRLNEEFGMTIILAEHRLDEVFTLADRIVMMDKGHIRFSGEPTNVLEEIWKTEHQPYVPSIPSLFLSTSSSNKEKIPLSVKEGRKWIQEHSFQAKQSLYLADNSNPNDSKIIYAKDISYRYRKDYENVLSDLEFTLLRGDIYALLGGNGSGKSTFLKILAGILKPSQGKVLLNDIAYKSRKVTELNQYIGYLPQNPKLFFIQDTIEKEVNETIQKWGVTNKEEVSHLLNRLGISHLLKHHPYDLSGGELQKAALACILLRKPEILLLDEPTKGLDPISKKNFASILTELQSEGLTVLMSTHDVEFAATVATRCGMMFQGNITSENHPEAFFKENYFYTTMIQRIFRNSTEKDVVTLEEAIDLCKSSVE